MSDRNAGRFFLHALLIVGTILLQALSAHAQERTSITEPAKPGSAPTATQSSLQPEPAVILKSTDALKSDAAAKENPQITKEADKPVAHIALLMPLASKAFGRVADAVKLGFVAGAEAEGKNAPPYRIYTADDEGASLAAQCRKAMADGAMAIIGGLTRDGASTIVRESRLLPTLALNAPDASGDSELPDRLFYISLNLDIEARLVARMASGEGHRNVVLLVASNPLAKRIQESFEKEWLRLNGEKTATISFGRDPNDATRVASAMEKLGTKVDAVFLAADPSAARFVRPYLPSGMPVFATSHSIDPRAEAVANLDLDNVRFLEMPWFAEQDHPAVMAYAKPAQPMAVELERLYALGIDAWRLGQLITKNENTRNLPPLDGVTGRITFDGHQLVRALSSVEIRDGRSRLFRPSE